MASDSVQDLSTLLLKNLQKQQFNKNYAYASDILKMVGAGLFLASSVVAPNLPKSLKPLFNSDASAYSKFNIFRIRRTLARLHKNKLVEFAEENGEEIIRITKEGRVKLLKYTLDEVELIKPKLWNGYWYLVSYDIPKHFINERKALLSYLRKWHFYKMHDSLYIHAYPCENEITFLFEYLGVGDSVKFFIVKDFENSKVYRDYFDV